MVAEGQPSGRDEKYVKLRNFLQGKLGIYYTGDMEVDASRWRSLIDARGFRGTETETSFRRMMENAGFTTISDNLFGQAGTTEKVPRSGFRSKYDRIVKDFLASALQKVVDGADTEKVLAPFGGTVTGAAQIGAKLAGDSGGVNVFENSEFTTRVQASAAAETAAPAPIPAQHDSIPVASGEPSRLVTGGTSSKQEPLQDVPNPSPSVDTNPLATLSPTGSSPAGATPSPVGGGSTAGGGASGSSSATSGGVAGEGGAAVQVPGEYQLWQIDGQRIALAYKVPGEDMFLTYDFPDPATLQALFPAGVPGFDAVMSSTGINGVLLDANGNEVASFIGDGRGVVALNNTSEHPFANMEQTWALRAERNEVYSDPDFLAKLAETIIEGRPLTQDDLYEIDSIARNPDGSPRTDAEIARTLNIWTMSTGEYERGVSGQREAVRRQLAASGVVLDENSEGVIAYMAGQVFAGSWAVEDVALQANILSGASREPLDAGLQRVMEGVELNTLPNQIAGLRAEAERWLGPAVTGNLADSYFRHWAQEILQDPNKQAAFTDSLRGQFATNFNNFTNNPNGNLTYEDIAPTYRGLVQKVWGEHADEDDPFFVSLLQGNDMEAAAKALRKKGLDMGKSKITSEVLSSMGQAFGGQVARSI